MKLLSVLALALVAGSAFAQQYKYVDANGRTVYSDTPPPPGARVVAKTQGGKPAFVEQGGLPYALSQPAKNFPVVLFSGPNCEACNNGRALLNKRGIPFQEKTVNSKEDQDAFQAAAGTTNIPVMMVGNTKQVGYQEEAWNAALDFASYPKTNQLPPGYKNQPPVASAPDKKPEAAPTQTAAAGAPQAPAATAPAAPAGEKPPEWLKRF